MTMACILYYAILRYMKLAILMSAYNGADYLEEQVRSILSQTYNDFTLYIRDDGSSDGTVALVGRLAAADSRIRPITHGGNLGAKESFMWLLRNVDADYYMFCDHDDVWLPRKVEITLRRMLEGERQCSGPVIACTNLKLVDAGLNVYAESYWRYRHYRMSFFNDRYYHLFYNNMPGCTMMLNQKAKEVCFPYSPDIVMHDAWFVIATLWNGGLVVAEPEPLMLYRQHEHNVVGARGQRTLWQQLGMVGRLMRRTRTQYLSTRRLTGMWYPCFVARKVYYMLDEHIAKLIGR